MIDGHMHGKTEETRAAATEWEMRHDGYVLPGGLLASELGREACFIIIGDTDLVTSLRPYTKLILPSRLERSE